MLRRPLPAFLGLTIVDYLAWNWFVAHGPQVLALICGLALTPLLLAVAWNLVVAGMRLLAARGGLSGRRVVRRALPLGSHRAAAAAADGPVRRRGATFPPRRVRRALATRRPARYLPEHEGRQPGESGARASSPERIAA